MSNKDFIPYGTMAGMDQYVDSKYSSLRYRAAEAKYALDRLIDDPDPAVRAEVALQGYGFNKLILDKEINVRRAVYQGLANASTTPSRKEEILRNGKNHNYDEMNARPYIVLWEIRNPSKCAPELVKYCCVCNHDTDDFQLGNERTLQEWRDWAYDLVIEQNDFNYDNQEDFDRNEKFIKELCDEDFIRYIRDMWNIDIERIPNNIDVSLFELAESFLHEMSFQLVWNREAGKIHLVDVQEVYNELSHKNNFNSVAEVLDAIPFESIESYFNTGRLNECSDVLDHEDFQNIWLNNKLALNVPDSKIPENSYAYLFTDSGVDGLGVAQTRYVYAKNLVDPDNTWDIGLGRDNKTRELEVEPTGRNAKIANQDKLQEVNKKL